MDDKKESIDDKIKKVNSEIAQILDDWKAMSHDALARVNNYEKIKGRLQELKLKEPSRSFTEYAFCRYCRFLVKQEYTKRLNKDEDFRPVKEWGDFCVLKNQPTDKRKTCSQFMEKRDGDIDGDTDK